MLPPDAAAQSQPRPAQPRPALPPRAAQARRFLARRGLRPGDASRIASIHATEFHSQARPRPQAIAGTALWQPLGPASVTTPYFGAISGRVASIALDPSDTTGNTAYIGTTGGGVWFSSNAASDPSYVRFTPLTDSVSALNGVLYPSISVGAVSVQPGATGVILAGTGDPNDALDSYYGAGILRSTDNGATWSLIQQSADADQGTGLYDFGFYGLGFAGFAWSGKDPLTVVAAASESYQSLLVGMDAPSVRAAGLYYSTDAGATWHLATITDLNGQNVQSPFDPVATPEGVPATSVVWNPVRKLFVAAVRYHGYYSSPDGMTWTQLAAQPGPDFTAQNCPTNTGLTGSPACPVFRGTLAVNPQTGDTFAWSVDIANQDQGIWQDLCAKESNGQCANANFTFGVQLTTRQLESDQPNQGPATILNGDYNLALAAVPSGQDTMILAGANDLWQCTIAPPSGAPLASVYCPWRNTTNTQTCLSAGVAPYQHALAWNEANPLEVLIGNDSGLWRSMDGVAETGSICDKTDATHFQNLNPSLGSLAEVESLAASPATPYTMMLGLGVNGTAGVKNTSGPTSQWPRILSGAGGPAVIDPSNPDKWYVNNGAGVSIHLCSQSTPCTQADFGESPVIGNADVANDGLTMTEPAPFLVDPADPTQLLVATCRLWRGSASGGWSSTNAVTPMLGAGSSAGYCSGNALIRSITALKLPGGGEVVYVGTYGRLDGGATLPGHILSATMDANGTWSPWSDLTFSPVQNDVLSMNFLNMDVSSLYVDPADTTGKTIYATIEGVPSQSQPISTVYRSTDGGANWYTLTSNLPYAPANSIAVDPADPNTVYVATDTGVYATRQVASCATAGVPCWAPMGSGLPISPVVALSATPVGGAPSTLVAGTYGRGVWQIPLFTAGQLLTTATLSPTSLSFPDQPVSSSSSPLSLTVTNTGGVGLSVTSVTLSGTNATDFTEADDCAGQEVVAGSSCTIQLFFQPTATGPRTAQVTVAGNLSGGSLTATLSGTALPAAQVTIAPSAIAFGNVPVKTESDPRQLTIQNASSTPVAVSSFTVSPPFRVAFNSCGSTLAASFDCSLSIVFAPTSTGRVNGTATLVDDRGTQTVQLVGTGTSLPTDTLAPASLSFPGTIINQPSAAQTVTLTNSGQNPLTDIQFSVTGPFQQTNNCTTQLAAQSTCAINVVFLPTAAGKATGTLALTDINSATPQTITLTGTGLNPPLLTPSVASIDFGNVAPGKSSAAKSITVTNTGGAPMANIGFNLTGVSASSFSVTPSTCAATLAIGASCSGKLVFTPVSSAGVTASLAISSSTRGVTPASVLLLGNGGAPGNGIEVKPGSIVFPTTSVGAFSSPVTVTLTNTNPLQALENLVVTPPDGFTLQANTCGNSLAAGASCTVAVSFAPTAIGPKTGTLTIASSTLLQPATVALSGTGFDFTVAIAGAPTVTVASGQTAIFTLSLATLGGAPGTFTFQCGPLPQQAACVFNPVTNNLPADATGTQTIDITTSKSTVALVSPRMTASSRAALLACGLLLFPLALRKRRGFLCLLATLAITLSAVTSCASSSGGSNNSGGKITTTTTPAGTYTIPVAVSATGAVTPITSCASNGAGTGAQRCINLEMVVE